MLQSFFEDRIFFCQNLMEIFPLLDPKQFFIGLKYSYSWSQLFRVKISNKKSLQKCWIQETSQSTPTAVNKDLIWISITQITQIVQIL